MDRQDLNTQWPLVCDRCLCRLERSVHEFFTVRIEAFLDSLPQEDLEELKQVAEPRVKDDIEDDPAEITDMPDDLEGVAEDLIEELYEFCDELRQIHRRVELTLCRPCYEQWIENPTG